MLSELLADFHQLCLMLAAKIAKQDADEDGWRVDHHQHKDGKCNGKWKNVEEDEIEDHSLLVCHGECIISKIFFRGNQMLE